MLRDNIDSINPPWRSNYERDNEHTAQRPSERAIMNNEDTEYPNNELRRRETIV